MASKRLTEEWVSGMKIMQPTLPKNRNIQITAGKAPRQWHRQDRFEVQNPQIG